MVSNLQTYIDNHAVGFGDTYFAIVGDAQWTKKQTLVEKRVPGSNITIYQDMGSGPETVTYSLVLASVDDYQTLKDAQGTTDTLTLLPDIAAVERTSIVIAGQIYDQITDAFLREVSAPKTEVGGYITCTATWTYQPA